MIKRNNRAKPHAKASGKYLWNSCKTAKDIILYRKPLNDNDIGDWFEN